MTHGQHDQSESRLPLPDKLGRGRLVTSSPPKDVFIGALVQEGSYTFQHLHFSVSDHTNHDMDISDYGEMTQLQRCYYYFQNSLSEPDVPDVSVDTLTALPDS